MLVPEFKLSQNNTHVSVHIRVPYVKVSSAEFYIEAKMFKFYLKPYLLTLGFEQNLKEVEEPSKAVYYHEKHILSVELEKETKGQYFENLNLISSLLEKKDNKKTKDKRVLIELVSEQGTVVHSETGQNQTQYGYGFCGNYCGVFKNLEEECGELFMFDPSSVLKEDRYELSRKVVLDIFDENLYMFDKVSNFDEIDGVLASKCIEKLAETLKKLEKEPYTFQKFKAISKIPKKQIIVNPKKIESIIKQLISIGFCYIYEYECMEGDLGPESAKTINQASAVLSCQVSYEDSSLEQTIFDSSRRCVTFCLYKNIQICEKVCRNLGGILSKNFLLEMLLEIRVMFEKCEPRYLLNRIYIDDFCTFLLNENEKMEKELLEYGKRLADMAPTISEKELDLELELEQQQDLDSSIKVESQLQNLLSLD